MEKETIELVKKMIEDGNLSQETAEKYCPELKESEDERIRKNCIHFLELQKQHHAATFEIEECISWLEKQGEHANFRNKIQVGDKVTRNEDGVLVNLSQLNRVAKKDEKQCEQKPADMVEPKFKVGDWVVYCGKTYQITGLNNDIFTITGCDGGYFFNMVKSTNEPVFRLWTIEDAKDGDVLATSAGAFIYNGNNGGGSCPGSYCGIDNLGEFKTGVEHHWTCKKVYPATKEQRDLLFQKMKEAGYEWDADKKKLEKDEIKIKAGRNYRCTKTHIYAGLDWLEGTKYYADDDYSLVNNGCTCFCPKYSKYEHNNLFEEVECDGCIEKQCEQKPSWSEVDENAFDSILNDLRQGVMPDDEDMNWLKSLKDRYTWKPSDEQMNNLEYISTHPSHIDDQNIKIIRSLYNDLKKLI